MAVDDNIMSGYLEPLPKRACLDVSLEIPDYMILNVTHGPTTEIIHAEEEGQTLLSSCESQSDESEVSCLRERFSDLLDTFKFDVETSDPMDLLEKDGKSKHEGYILLTKLLVTLVEAMDIADTKDENVEKVFLLALSSFEPLRQNSHDEEVRQKLSLRLKTTITNYKQKRKMRANAVREVEKQLSQLREAYPALANIGSRNLSSGEVRPYGETAREIVQAIGITDPYDGRINHAVTLMMDQYAVLKEQITNASLRRMFLYRIRQALSTEQRTKLKRPVKLRKENGPSYLEEVTAGGFTAPGPLIVELDVETYGDNGISPDDVFQASSNDENLNHDEESAEDIWLPETQI